MDSSQQSWVEKEAVLIEFDRRWADGTQPDIEKFVTDQSDKEQLVELVQIDLEYQWQSGNKLTAEHYFEKFPSLEDSAHRWTVLTAEFAARSIVDSLPDPLEVKERFGNELQKVQQLIDTVAEQSRSENSVKDTGRCDEMDAARITPVSGDLIGHYRLVEPIGGGTFSTVWSACDDDLDRLVAIKILRPELLSNSDVVRRMMREARAAAQLEHAAIVRVHEVGNHMGLPFIVTQLINGSTLQKHIEDEPFSFDDVATIAREIAKGIHFAHCDGIVHRDIKPANILMSDRLTPLIADFGLASHLASPEIRMTMSGDILGTPAYMSPEQAAGNNHLPDLRTDIYSIGVLLYRMLTGRLPFEGSMSSVIHKVMNDVPPSPRTINQSIPRDLETITLKCLEKLPGDRFNTAEDLAIDLQNYLDREPVNARPVGFVERSFRWTRKRPKLAALILGITILTGFLIGSRFQLNVVKTQKEQAQVLLAQTERNAGRLAMQRGRMSLAVEHFEKSLEIGGIKTPPETLEFVEALVANRKSEAAGKYLAQLAIQPELSPEELASIDFWNAVIQLENGQDEEALRLFKTAVEGELNPSDRGFAKAMLAHSTPIAIEHLQRAVENNSLSHHSRRILIWLMYSLSDFEGMERQLEIADNLFPQDDDFVILRAMYHAGQSESTSAQRVLSNSGLDDSQLNLWQTACEAIVENVNTYSHGTNKKGFDENAIRDISDAFCSDILPAMNSRGLCFPPRISRAFTAYLDSIPEHRVALFGGGWNETGVHEEATNQLSSLVDIHPESSLVLALAAQNMAAEKLDVALNLAEVALVRQGFIPDTRRVSIETAVACSVVLIHRRIGQSLEVDSALYDTFLHGVDLLDTDPELIAKYSTQKSGTPVIQGLIHAITAEACEKEKIAKWLARIEAADEASQEDILWIKTVVAIRTKNWFEVIELCNLLLEMKDQGSEQINRQQVLDARDAAKRRITELDFVETEKPAKTDPDTADANDDRTNQ